jgi:non-ribosomal peptide synthetase component F
VGDIYLMGLEANAANYAPLTPLVFLDWSADVYPGRLAVVHGRRRFTWAQTRERCQRLASALAARGCGPWGHGVGGRGEYPGDGGGAFWGPDDRRGAEHD